MIATLAVLVAASAAATVALVPLARRLALAAGAVDRPDERRVHDRPMPRLGGLAIFAAAATVLGVAAALGVAGGDADGRPLAPGGLVLAAAAALVFAVGLADDLRPLRAATKLLVEVAAAAALVHFGECRITGLSAPGGALELGALGGPFTVLWIVGVTNAVNLIDGIDGLAAGFGALTLAAILLIATWNEPAATVPAAVLLGCCLGFLVFNFHPASIFLGDGGSLFLGFSIGALSTYARAKGTTGAATAAILLLVGLPLGDALFAVLRRYRSGLDPTSLRSHLSGLGRLAKPDRGHIHHRLLRAGLGQRAAAFVLYAIQAAACVGAIYLLLTRR